MSTTTLKARLKAGKPTIGSWITLAHPAMAEIMARAGFDWLTVDLEHSVISLREAEELIRIIRLCGLPALARVSSNDPVQIKRVMDAGATGVIVPMVNSKADAQKAVSAVRYPPAGTRGVGLARAQGYGARFEEYKAWLEKESVVIVQIEHEAAVRNLEEILEVPGVDGFVVGPYDLSGSLGVPGQFDHPAMRKALSEIMRKRDSSGPVPGFHVVPPEPGLVAEKLAEGYKFIAYSADMLLLGDNCRRGLKEIRSSLR